MSMLGADRAALANEVDRSSDTEDTQPVKVRAKVKALEVHVRCGASAEERALPQTLLVVDLEYVYEAQGDNDISGLVDYGVLPGRGAQVLEREDFQLVETGTRRVGEQLLKVFQEGWELTVCVTKVHVPVACVVSRVSVERIFSR